ncbi:MAG: class I SAM-dependent methyltransferase [Promethearchaeota archaeon]
MQWLIFMQWLMIGFLLIIFFACLLIRVVRRYRKFPIPSCFTRLIDNPWRRRLVQKPSTVADQVYLKPGMVVVEIGPGKGSYTLEFAKRVLPDGKVYAVDISKSVIIRLKQRVAQEKILNIIPQIDNAHSFSFADESIDRVIAIACLPEIPQPVKVLQEIHRILKPDGLVSLSELAPDPDYPRRKTTKRWATEAGFTLHSEFGNWFVYQLNFKKA